MSSTPSVAIPPALLADASFASLVGQLKDARDRVSAVTSQISDYQARVTKLQNDLSTVHAPAAQALSDQVNTAIANKVKSLGFQ